MRVLLLAEEAAGRQMVRAVAQSRHEIVAVMTSGGGTTQVSPVRDLVERLGYPCWEAARVKEPAFAACLQAAEVDLIVNVHSLFVLPEAVLAAPRLGAYNLHPGRLPEYAGLNAVSWALYRGETMQAVTVHRMVREIDAGPIAYQTGIAIDEQDTALSLSVKCTQAGVPLLLQLLQTAATDPGAIPALAQDRSRARYHGKKEVPQRGRLIWNRPARDIVNFTRACDYLPFRSPWGHPVGRVGGREVAVVKATGTQQPCGAPPGTVGDVTGRAVRVAAADEWVLVHRVVTDGRLIDAHGPLLPGQRFEPEDGA